MPHKGLKDFRDWFECNTGRFKAENYTKEDITNLAVACGFNRQLIAQWAISELFKGATR